jgi:hypothetical protein
MIREAIHLVRADPRSALALMIELATPRRS